MKILSGSLKGRNFFMPAEVQPTQDKTRKAVFDIIGHDLEDLSFLDLFAGSGAVGFEAFSNKAKRVVFVERDARCRQVIQDNFDIFCGGGTVGFDIIGADAFIAIKRMHERHEKFDIIFADPPFEADLAKKTLKTLGGCDIVGANSLLIIQHDKKETLPDTQGRFLRVRERKYGGSLLSIYKTVTPLEENNGENSHLSGEF